MDKPTLEPYLTSGDGEFFNLSFSYGNIEFEVYDLEEKQILQITADIENMLYLLKHGGSDDLRDRKEAQMQECLVE